MADGLARGGFDMDLPHGEARESAFVKALTTCRVEHKCDGWAPATGNVAVEYEQQGRPSGIMVTTAQFWPFEIQDDVWLVIRTSLLKVAVARAVKEGRAKLIGDHNQYRNALIPVEWLYRGTPPPQAA
jgi:hypothetical protein